MTKFSFIIGWMMLFSTTKTFACSCYSSPPFMEVANYTSIISYVKVIKFLTFNEIYGKKMPMSMEVEILEVYKGVETRKTVTVWGDPGHLCRVYLSTFKEGEYYVMGLNNGQYGGSHPDEKVTDYTISSCGTFWLKADAKKATVSGDIYADKNPIDTVTFSQLKEKLKALTF